MEVFERASRVRPRRRIADGSGARRRRLGSARDRAPGSRWKVATGPPEAKDRWKRNRPPERALTGDELIETKGNTGRSISGGSSSRPPRAVRRFACCTAGAVRRFRLTPFPAMGTLGR